MVYPLFVLASDMGWPVACRRTMPIPRHLGRLELMFRPRCAIITPTRSRGGMRRLASRKEHKEKTRACGIRFRETDLHLAELAAPGVPARRFDLNESGLGLAAKIRVGYRPD